MKSEGIPTEIDWELLEGGETPDLEMATMLLDPRIDCEKLRPISRKMISGKRVTYSRNVTIPITRLCRNRCSYCGFKRESAGYLEWDEVIPLLREAEECECCEALIMSGERPELAYGGARSFLRRRGFKSTPEYVAWLCGRVLDETELLPHTNIGNLDADELSELKKVNASMGIMLEDASERLCVEGMPHHESPGKNPRVRIGTIEEAGRHKIPFTTGILVGIGQTGEEIARSLFKIGELHEKHGHIQEVIIQRFIPKRGTPMESCPPPSTGLMTKVISVARLILGSKMNIQIPPNIEKEFELMIQSGANDLGGISPLTPDEINPGQPWCSENEIFKRISSIGYRAELRPPVYREFAREVFLQPHILEKSLTWFRRFEDDARHAKS
jgi:7,8-didemethyl-8-hydroxy-5-deazariboflavin synthase CofG subunit